MIWIIYLLASIFTSLFLARISKRYFYEIFFLLLIFFITPAQVEVSLLDYAPSVFTFIFNIILEQNFSMRVLRPLLLTIPIGFFSVVFYLFFKRKFF